MRRLESYFQAPGADGLFQERYVTVRHGRYVLPVLASAKGRVRGIVHDRSQSGATLFIEPEAVVEDNNELVQAGREEEAEILKVLGELTDAVRQVAPALEDADRRPRRARPRLRARRAGRPHGRRRARRSTSRARWRSKAPAIPCSSLRAGMPRPIARPARWCRSTSTWTRRARSS